MQLVLKSKAEVALEKKLNNQVPCRVERARERAGHRACFWTWPFGHIWDGATRSGIRVCVCCGKSSAKGTYDGDWKYDLTRK